MNLPAAYHSLSSLRTDLKVNSPTLLASKLDNALYLSNMAVGGFTSGDAAISGNSVTEMVNNSSSYSFIDVDKNPGNLIGEGSEYILSV